MIEEGLQILLLHREGHQDLVPATRIEEPVWWGRNSLVGRVAAAAPAELPTAMTAPIDAKPIRMDVRIGASFSTPPAAISFY